MICSSKLSLYCLSYRGFCSIQSNSQGLSTKETWSLKPSGFWKVKENQHEYMNWLSQKLNIKTMEDWYKVTQEDIIQNHGRTVINHNNGSHINLIKSVYSNYNWLPWKFNRSPKNFWQDENNVKTYMNWLSEKLNIKTMEDWYKVSYEDIIANYGSGLIALYNGSHINLIKSVYPNYNWLPWRFKNTPKGFWQDEKNIKEYMNWLSEKLNIKTMEDWYKITKNDIIKNYGDTLITFYYSSYINLIMSAYPNYKWLPWKFNRATKGFWKKEENVKEYMNWLSEKLNIKTMEDWYKVSREDITQNYGNTLVKSYESHINLISSVYPNYNWLPWKFGYTPKGFWKDESNINAYMKWLSETLDIKTMEDWYKVSHEDIIQNCGNTLITLNNGSHINLITNIYPNYNWLPWKFNNTPKGFWQDEKNIKEYMNWLSEKLNIKTMEDWYKVTQEDIAQNYGRTLLNNIDSINNLKIQEILQKVYPEYKWDAYQFLKVRKGYASQLLKDSSLQKEFISYLEKKFNIKQTSDWYTITSNQLQRVITIDLHSVLKIIKNFYPEIDIGSNTVKMIKRI